MVTGTKVHYQLLYVFSCFIIEAAMEFFGIEEVSETPTKNRPNYAFMSIREHKQKYFEETLDKFVDQFVTGDAVAADESHSTDHQVTSFVDGGTIDDSGHGDNIMPVHNLRNYSRNILQYFLEFEDYCDAVREGDGKRMAQIHKDFLLYFKTDRSFNAYAIEMMINVAQNEVLLSEQEAHRAIWSQTVNWNGGEGKNVEADLMQEN